MTYPLINGAEINGADGFSGSAMTTQYGVPSAVTILHATGAAFTLYGAAKIKSGNDKTLLTQGVAVTRYGVPLCIPSAASVGITTLSAASAGPLVQYGTPSIKASVSLSASGQAPSTQYGAPRAVAILRPAGACGTRYGSPNATASHRSAGVSGTAYGTPKAIAVIHAIGRMSTSYGVHSVAGTAAAKAQGACSTQFGAPRAGRIARALPGAPSARFGRPIILRGTRC